MKKKDEGYYRADTMHGVHKWDMMDSPDSDIVRPKDFLAGLPILEDDKCIITFMDRNDEDVFNEIEMEYGIH